MLRDRIIQVGDEEWRFEQLLRLRRIEDEEACLRLLFPIHGSVTWHHLKKFDINIGSSNLLNATSEEAERRRREAGSRGGKTAGAKMGVADLPVQG